MKKEELIISNVYEKPMRLTTTAQNPYSKLGAIYMNEISEIEKEKSLEKESSKEKKDQHLKVATPQELKDLKTSIAELLAKSKEKRGDVDADMLTREYMKLTEAEKKLLDLNGGSSKEQFDIRHAIANGSRELRRELREEISNNGGQENLRDLPSGFIDIPPVLLSQVAAVPEFIEAMPEIRFGYMELPADPHVQGFLINFMEDASSNPLKDWDNEKLISTLDKAKKLDNGVEGQDQFELVKRVLKLEKNKRVSEGEISEQGDEEQILDSELQKIQEEEQLVSRAENKEVNGIGSEKPKIPPAVKKRMEAMWSEAVLNGYVTQQEAEKAMVAGIVLPPHIYEERKRIFDVEVEKGRISPEEAEQYLKMGIMPIEGGAVDTSSGSGLSPERAAIDRIIENPQAFIAQATEQLGDIEQNLPHDLLEKAGSLTRRRREQFGNIEATNLLNVPRFDVARYVGTPLADIADEANLIADSSDALDPQDLRDLRNRVRRVRGVPRDLQQEMLSQFERWKPAQDQEQGQRNQDARALDENKEIAALREWASRISDPQEFKRLLSMPPGNDPHLMSDEFKRIENLLNMSGYSETKRKEFYDDIKDAAGAGMDAMRKAFNAKLVALRRDIREAGYFRRPENIIELGEMIMAESKDKWKKEYPLVENGRLNKDNFLRWLRDRIQFYDDFSPDGEVNMFSSVRAVTPIREIQWQEIYTVDDYFKDEQGELMEDFRERCLHEVWLFQEARNWNVQYMRAMGQEEQLSKALQTMFYTNTFTKTSTYDRSTLEWILTMSKNQTLKLDSTMSDEKYEGDQLIGKGVRTSLLAYNYITDVQMLRNIFGDDSTFFKREAEAQEEKVIVDSATNTRRTEVEKQTIKRKFDNSDAEKEWDEMFDANGRLRFDGTVKDKNGKEIKVVDKFAEYLDPFSDHKKDPRIISDVRARMSAAIQERSRYTVGTYANRGIYDVKPLDLEDAKYAERWAFKMSRWTGIGATGSADGAYKWFATKEYREGQQESRRQGFIGNLYNKDSFRALGANLMEGITDARGKSLLEIVQGGQGDTVSGLDDDVRGVIFKNNTMQKYADDHTNRVQHIWEHVIDQNELNFHSFTKFDPVRGIVFDAGKAREVIDGIQKHIRYAYGTWDLLDPTKVVRIKEEQDNGEVVFKNVTLAEKMFGGAILEKYKLKRSDFTNMSDKERKFYEDNPDVTINIEKFKADKRVFWHNVMDELIAREIESHTDPASPYPPYAFHEREMYLDFVEKWYGKRRTERIRKIAKAPFGKMMIRALAVAILGGTIQGLKKGGEEFIEDLEK